MLLNPVGIVIVAEVVGTPQATIVPSFFNARFWLASRCDRHHIAQSGRNTELFSPMQSPCRRFSKPGYIRLPQQRPTHWLPPQEHWFHHQCYHPTQRHNFPRRLISKRRKEEQTRQRRFCNEVEFSFQWHIEHSSKILPYVQVEFAQYLGTLRSISSDHAFDAAFDVLDVFESLLAQKFHRRMRARADFAKQIILRVRVEFGETLCNSLIGSSGTPSMCAISYSNGSRTSMTLMPSFGSSNAFFMSCTVTSSGLPFSAGVGSMPQNTS